MRNQAGACMEWGPYSKKYMGISRVMAESDVSGARFDLVALPTYANSGAIPPNVCFPSGWHPWDAAEDGSCYTFRCELIWKDQLYADVAFFRIDPESWGIRVEYHNRTDRMQNCMLNLFAAIEYPQKCRRTVERPEKSEYWSALAFEEYSLARKRPWDRLTPDGLRRGQVVVSEFVDGEGLGETWYSLAASHLGTGMFGSDAGDFVSYRLRPERDYEDAVLTVRYRTTPGEASVVFDTDFGALTLEGTGKEPRTAALELGPLPAGRELLLRLTSRGSADKNGVVLDFFCITERTDAERVCVRELLYDVIPEITEGDQGSVCYRYKNGEKPLFLTVFWDRVRKRELHTGCLEDALPTRLSNSDPTYDDLTMSFTGSFSRRRSDDGYYHNLVAEAVFVPAGESRVVYACIGSGQGYCGSVPEVCRESLGDGPRPVRSQGEEFAFSVRLLKAALFSNVVYPIERHGVPVIHYTPGKRWDSLYTWDSGFIGIGMAEYAPERAEYIMDLYLSEEDNADFAFLFHGSVIPTQFFLWYELLQKAVGAKKEALLSYYPAFRRYYLFFAGKAEGSTTGRYASGLLTPYDYFYNAGGMDDYPAQVQLHRQKLENETAPVCTSVFLIRIARFMRAIAARCGKEADIEEYEADIRRVSSALLSFAWDEKSGYFGYVRHDADGNPKGIFRTVQGENWNRGMDGVTPLLAGVGDKEQTERMLGHLRSGQELWSSAGLSTVDMSASYYYDNGYWNGSVWFPYQYLLWKAMLDLGEGELAWEIAHRALTVWKKETEFSYNTFEMIQIKTGRGGWYHQFGGLSAPVCSFFGAYYRVGTVTAGFDVWIEDYSFTGDAHGARIAFDGNGKTGGILLVALAEDADYEALYDGKSLLYREHVRGTLEIVLPAVRGELLIREKTASGQTPAL